MVSPSKAGGFNCEPLKAALAVDENATASLRKQMRSERGEVPFFDHGPNFKALKEAGRV